jgi:hypothetical protein
MRISGESPRYEPIALPLEGSPAAARPAWTGPSGPSFASVLKSVGKTIDAGEALLARSAHGGFSGLDSGQLIALQTRVYQYSEAVDLTAKLVDRATTAVRTIVSPH